MPLTKPKLGINIPNRGISDALFTKTQQKVLTLLFGQPERAFYANEMIALASSGAGAVQRELQRLTEVGLLKSWRVGNQKFYQANAESPIFSELSGIVVKTFGVAEALQKGLLPVWEQFDFAFVYGSIAKGSETVSSDIDLLVVGDIRHQRLLELLHPTQTQLCRVINTTLYSKNEWAQRVQDKKSFIMRITEQPKIFIKGTQHDLGIHS